MSVPEANKIYLGECSQVMSQWPDECIDLTVTSPPYDNLRAYNGYDFPFEAIAQQLYRVTKEGGVVVWVVGDATVNGSETGTSFRQALYLKEIGFNLHDTMIWEKHGFSVPSNNRYHQIFEYMFVMTKGCHLVFNPIKDRKNIYEGQPGTFGENTKRDKNGEQKTRRARGITQKTGTRFNVWKMKGVNHENVGKPISHPAQFPFQLAQDHIFSWSNEGDTVLDPFLGSGTTAVAAIKLNRKYVGIEISPEYWELANQGVSELKSQVTMFDIIKEQKEGVQLNGA